MYPFLMCLIELMQTEMHHIRTLRIMSEVYSKGLQKELQLEQQTLEKLFPTLDDLLELHTQNLLRLLERKRECQLEGANLEGGFIINRIGDLLVRQVSECKACVMFIYSTVHTVFNAKRLGIHVEVCFSSQDPLERV